MSDEDIVNEIKKSKEKVAEIVRNIQILKKQLTIPEISMREFKEKKTILEDELRNVLKQIGNFKSAPQEPAQIKKIARPIVPTKPQTVEPTQPETLIHKEEITNTQFIKKESQIAREAKDLSYFYQTEFNESLTNAKIYLPITLDHHFIISVDYSNYPERPIVNIPPELVNLLVDDKKKNLGNVPSYINWVKEKPKRIYDIIREIESLLSKAFQTDVPAIPKDIFEIPVETKKKDRKDLEKRIKEKEAELKGVREIAEKEEKEAKVKKKGEGEEKPEITPKKEVEFTKPQLIYYFSILGGVLIVTIFFFIGINPIILIVSVGAALAYIFFKDIVFEDKKSSDSVAVENEN